MGDPPISPDTRRTFIRNGTHSATPARRFSAEPASSLRLRLSHSCSEVYSPHPRASIVVPEAHRHHAHGRTISVSSGLLTLLESRGTTIRNGRQDRHASGPKTKSADGIRDEPHGREA